MYYRQTKEVEKMKKQQKSFLPLAIAVSFIASAILLSGIIGASDLKLAATPGPAMKTLDQIPPKWIQKLTTSERFELVMDGSAVLDKETGLVWEQSPNTTTRDWNNAWAHCCDNEVANRKGWRLPTVEELASLVDNENSPLALSTDHPFSTVQSSLYWSSTLNVGTAVPGRVWLVSFANGDVGFGSKRRPSYVWCVRGGYGSVMARYEHLPIYKKVKELNIVAFKNSGNL
jgi:hypothetical protein